MNAEGHFCGADLALSDDPCQHPAIYLQSDRHKHPPCVAARGDGIAIRCVEFLRARSPIAGAVHREDRLAASVSANERRAVLRGQCRADIALVMQQ